METTQLNEVAVPRVPYNPFTPVNVPEEGDSPMVVARQMIKDPEDRIYFVLYFNCEHEEFRWEKFVGRHNCYTGIHRILESESIDVRGAMVLVETTGVDPNTKKPRRYLMHPDDCSNIIEFCNAMEGYFPEESFNVYDYDNGEVTTPEEVWPSTAPSVQSTQEEPSDNEEEETEEESSDTKPPTPYYLPFSGEGVQGIKI